MNNEFKPENQTRKCYIIYILLYNTIKFFYAEV